MLEMTFFNEVLRDFLSQVDFICNTGSILSLPDREHLQGHELGHNVSHPGLQEPLYLLPGLEHIEGGRHNQVDPRG